MRIQPVIFCLAAAFAPALAHAQADEDAEMQLFELNDVLKQQTSVASTRALSVRETPGVVTVLSRDEILASGARDLLEVLLLVPGFTPGLDVEGVVDLGVRGIWGHEGKILLIVDGVEMNELLYSTNQLGLHYPVDQIAAIEVIRGPGSVRYGGDAELAVINVRTLAAEELNGGQVSVLGSVGDHSTGPRTLSAMVGGKTEKFGGLSATVSAYIGEGDRSDRNYVDPYGTSVSLAGNSALQPALLNVGLQFRDLHFRYIHDGYQMQELDSYGQAQPTPANLGFTTDAADLFYVWKPAPNLTITPRLTLRRQTPWEVLDENSTDYFTASVQRWEASVVAAYDLLDNLTLTAGVDGYLDHAWVNSLDLVGSQTFFVNNATEVTYRNIALLAEGQWASRFGNLIAGLRFEDNSAVGTSLVPRIALTKAFESFHFKLLASRAFRAPSIENISEGQDITPERTTGLEAEVGYAFTTSFFGSVNVYNTIITDPIIYSYDTATQTEYYKNFTQTGSRGFEVNLQYIGKLARGNLSYTYANNSPNDVDLYAVDGHPSMVLGMPTHKLSFLGSVKLWRELTLDPSLIFMSERYAYVGDGLGDTVLQRIAPVAILNVFAAYRDIGGSGVDVQVGVSNVLDQDIVYIQPYNGGHPPLPGQSREYNLRLTAHFM